MFQSQIRGHSHRICNKRFRGIEIHIHPAGHESSAGPVVDFPAFDFQDSFFRTHFPARLTRDRVSRRINGAKNQTFQFSNHTCPWSQSSTTGRIPLSLSKQSWRFSGITPIFVFAKPNRVSTGMSVTNGFCLEVRYNIA